MPQKPFLALMAFFVTIAAARRRGARWAVPGAASGRKARPAGRPASGRRAAALGGRQHAGPRRAAAAARRSCGAARAGPGRAGRRIRAQQPDPPAGSPLDGVRRRWGAGSAPGRAGPRWAAPGRGAPPLRTSAAQVPWRALLLVSRAFWRFWSRDGRPPAVARHSLGSADYFCKKSPSAFRRSWHVLALGKALQKVSGVLWCF